MVVANIVLTVFPSAVKLFCKPVKYEDDEVTRRIFFAFGGGVRKLIAFSIIREALPSPLGSDPGNELKPTTLPRIATNGVPSSYEATRAACG